MDEPERVNLVCPKCEIEFFSRCGLENHPCRRIRCMLHHRRSEANSSTGCQRTRKLRQTPSTFPYELRRPQALIPCSKMVDKSLFCLPLIGSRQLRRRLERGGPVLARRIQIDVPKLRHQPQLDNPILLFLSEPPNEYDSRITSSLVIPIRSVVDQALWYVKTCPLMNRTKELLIELKHLFSNPRQTVSVISSSSRNEFSSANSASTSAAPTNAPRAGDGPLYSVVIAVPSLSLLFGRNKPFRRGAAIYSDPCYLEVDYQRLRAFRMLGPTFTLTVRQPPARQNDWGRYVFAAHLDDESVSLMNCRICDKMCVSAKDFCIHLKNCHQIGSPGLCCEACKKYFCPPYLIYSHRCGKKEGRFSTGAASPVAWKRSWWAFMSICTICNRPYEGNHECQIQLTGLFDRFAPCHIEKVIISDGQPKSDLADYLIDLYFNEHEENVHQNEIILCGICLDKFASFKCLCRHLEVFHGIVPLEVRCNHCDENLTVDEAKRHLRLFRIVNYKQY